MRLSSRKVALSPRYEGQGDDDNDDESTNFRCPNYDVQITEWPLSNVQQLVKILNHKTLIIQQEMGPCLVSLDYRLVSSKGAWFFYLYC